MDSVTSHRILRVKRWKVWEHEVKPVDEKLEENQEEGATTSCEHRFLLTTSADDVAVLAELHGIKRLEKAFLWREHCSALLLTALGKSYDNYDE